MLYLVINSERLNPTYECLIKAAQAKNLQVKVVFSDKFDFSINYDLQKEDILYRISTDKTSKLVEMHLLNPHVTTCYNDYQTGLSRIDNGIQGYMLHQKLGLPIIKSIFCIPESKQDLQKYVESLGGFPVILKSTGAQNGNGILKLDSLDSLKSVLDYLSNTSDQFFLRQFIPHKEQIRAIVLGDQVIAHHTNLATSDFRSNATIDQERQRILKDYPNEVLDSAVQATKAFGLNFSGVDILIDQNTNQHFIAEVNFPTNFSRTQNLRNIDIASQLLDYLIQKSKS